MARRKVTTAPVLASWAETDKALRDIRECRHTLAELAVERDRKIDAAKDTYTTTALPVQNRVKELSYSEACKVIGELEARQGTPPPRPKKTNHRKRKPGGVSEGQERKVWALMYRLAAASPSTVAVGDRLRAAIKKEAGVDAFADDPFAWLDYKSCNKLIEALKGYVKNAERKAGAADG